LNLYAKLLEAGNQGKPLRVGLIRGGQFAAMYLRRCRARRASGWRDPPTPAMQDDLERIGWSPPPCTTSI
jgi:hypothetical protein